MHKCKKFPPILGRNPTTPQVRIGRARDAVWAAHVRTCLKVWYGQGGDMPVSRREGGRDEMSWAEYKTWVEGGGGDEWFVGDDVEAE